ncbi:MAG: hypothetical protein DRJ56_01465 [Thermoprotei archaeon]|nr:MAG: hypothetical protein DRJ56_01465 [Thermoprotei archaeon]
MRGSTIGRLELQVIEGLARSRSLASIASSLGVSKEAVRRHLRRLEYSQGRLSLRYDLYAMGLSYLVLVCDRVPRGLELAKSPYLRSVARTLSLGRRRVVIVMTPPAAHLRGYVASLLSSASGAGRAYVTYPPIYWIPDLRYIRDPEDPFNYDWGNLCRDVEEAPSELRLRLVSEAPPRKVDRIDLALIRELELNPLKSIRSIARRIGVSQQLAHYHYKRHVAPLVLSRNLRLAMSGSEALRGLVELEFESRSSVAKFLNVMSSIPHALALLVCVREPVVLLNYQVRASQYVEFIRAILELRDCGIVRSVSDLGLFYARIFSRRALPKRLPVTPSGWIPDEFASHAEAELAREGVVTWGKLA